MAMKFLPGMTNVLEVLNQMWDAFAAGPYNALPLTGGTLAGPVASSSTISPACTGAAPSSVGTGLLNGWWRVAKLDPQKISTEATIRLSGTTGYAALDGASNAMVTTILVRNDNDGKFRGSFYSVGSLTSNTIDDVKFGSDGTVYVSAGQYFVLGLYMESTMWLPQPIEFLGSGVNPPADAISAVRVWGLKLGTMNVVTVTPTLTYFDTRLISRDISPLSDNTYDIGLAATAYRTIYARTGAINTSDARLKCDFRDLTAAEIAAARELARAIGVYRWRDAVDSKGAAAREHIGPTVQLAIEIMQAHGLDPFGYGFICYDEWEQQSIEHPAVAAVPARDGHPATEARAAYTEVTLEAGDRYAFRYDELAMFIAAGQEAATVAMEARLAALEATP